MTGGRTTWWACDAAEHDRELPVELGLTHGPAGPYLLRVLKDLAQQQRDDGEVRTGFQSLGRKVFTDPAKVREIVEHAAEIGAIDDLSIDPDGRRFTCRISGWTSDQARGSEAIRKAQQRAELSQSDGTTPPVVPPEWDNDPPCPVETDVVPHTRPDLTREETTSLVDQVFDEWVAATERDAKRTKLTADRRRRIDKAIKSHGLDDCLTAVRNIGADAWARGENDRNRRFDDIDHALGTAERLERWRDQKPRVTSIDSRRNPAYQATRERRAAALAALQGGAA